MACKLIQLFELRGKHPQIKGLGVNSDSINKQNGTIALQSSTRIHFIRLSIGFLDTQTSVRGEDRSLAGVSFSGEINSHMWNDAPAKNESDGSSASIALSQQTGNLSIYKIMGFNSTCTTELHRLTLKGLIREYKASIDVPVSESQVLNFNLDLLTVLIDKILIVQLRVHETKPWQIVYTIPCPHQMLSASTTGSIIYLLDSDHSTLLYCLKTGEFLAVIKRQEGKNWTSCQLTTNYMHMIFQNDTGQLYCYNLDLYFQANPLLLSGYNPSQSTEQDSSGSHWYNKLGISGAAVSSGKASSHSSKIFTKIPFSGDCLLYRVSSEYATAQCHHKGSIRVCTYNIETDHTEQVEVDAEKTIVLSDIDTIPHIVIGDNEVSALFIGHCHKFYTQGDIKTGLLEAVADRNRWNKQTSSYSIQNLKRALEVRKLDFVLEFIKAKSSFIEDIMRSPPIDNRAEFKQMCELTHSAASTYIAHSTTRAFAQQISEAMVSFLKEQERRGISILNNMLMAENTEKKGLMETLLEKLSDHKMSFTQVSQLKKKSKKADSSYKTKSRDSRKTTSSSKLPAVLNDDLVRKWDSLSSKELIGDGILMGDISILQAYFTFSNRQAEASWDVIVKTGLQCVLDELEMRNWPTACQILKNMGFGVFTKLSQIAIYTTDKSLRNYLVEQLKMEGEFTESEKQAIQFSAEFDSLHPCPSFQQAVAEGRSGLYKDFPASDIFMVSKLCGEIGVVPPATECGKSRWYSHYMLDWMTHFIPNRDYIIIDRYIKDEKEESDMKLSEIEPVVLWSYLCRHDMVDMLLHWIDVQFSGADAIRSFQNKPITTNMVDISCSTLPVSSRLKVEGRLALCGCLDSTTLSSVEKRFSSLCRSGVILDRGQAETLLSLPDLVSHCLKHGLLDLLCQFLASWNVSDGDIQSLDKHLSGKDYLLTMMLYSFYKLSLMSSPGAKQILDASLASSRYLAKNPFLSFTEQLDQQLTDVALCNLMYHSPLLVSSDVSLSTEQLSTYREHPLLKHLLDTDNQQDDIGIVTIYTLLKKWGTLKEGRLFAVQLQEDAAPSEMAHFANQSLAAKYGLEEKLTFLYYLKQARPSFAFVVFLSDEMSLSNATTIPASRVKLTVNQTYFLAIKFYENLQITSSCVAFLELMGENTELLRLLINTAHILHKGKQLRNHSIESVAVHQQVECLLLPLLFGKKKSLKEANEELVMCAEIYISTLEGSSAESVLVYFSTSVEAGLKWRTVVAFSKHYKLPLPTRFLELCAADNHWLSFLVYSQVFKYEPHQLTSIVNMFTKDSIREHLQCVLDINTRSEVEFDFGYSSSQDEMRGQLHHPEFMESSRLDAHRPSLVSSSEDETRRNINQLAARVVEPAANGNSLHSQHTNHHLVSVEHTPNDIFAVLFMTSNRNGSWRQLNMYAVLLHNPVLAVLAACNKESDLLECLSSWLIGWLDGGEKMANEYMDPHTGRYVNRASAISVISLAIEKYNLLQLVRTGLRIFMRSSPLIALLDAIEELPRQQFFIVAASLNRYKALMKKVAQSESTRDTELTFVQLVDLSLLTIQSCIQDVDSFLCERFLHLLDEANLFTIFRSKRVNFAHAYKTYKLVYDMRLEKVNKVELISYQYVEEVKHVIQILESRKVFDKARKLSLACDLDPQLVTVQELISDAQYMQAQPSWSHQTDHTDFWSQCNDKCIRHDLEAEKCSTYFETQCTLSSNLADKITLSEYALKWMQQAPTAYESTNIHRLRKLVWQNKINSLVAEGEAEKLPLGTDSTTRSLVSVSIDKTQFLHSHYKYEDFIKLMVKPVTHPDKSNGVEGAVCQLIGQLLDKFHIDEACQVSVEYGVTTTDVVIILVCMGLATNTLDPANLLDEVKSLYAEKPQFKRRSSSLSQNYLLTVSSVEDYYPATDTLPSTYSDDRLVLLQKLSGRCEHGVMSCDKIACCYAIALALGQAYTETILQSEYSLLKQLLSSKATNRFQLSLDYINTCFLSDSDIASFLASNVYNSLNVLAGLDSSKTEMMAEQMSASVEECMKAGKECKQLIQLFSDQTVFGQSLLEQATTMCIDEPDVKLKLVVKVELLILSHDAYTCAYDMEGISGVLRACRTCAIQMNEVSYYTLMIHMLMDIGRFSEMTYIFDTLKQNHQFELLFRKGMSKDNKLKLAVLDYLRRFCPGDNDIYRVVSSHFAMYREIAQLLEQSALKKLKNLRIVNNKQSDLLSSSLSDVQKNLTDAAEIYMEGQCLRHAQNCVKQARLVFLQNSLLSSGVQVVNLEPGDVKSLLETHDKFYEVFTVSDAYNKSYWAASICNNVLIKGDLKFLSDFKKSLVLSSSLITEIVQRFQLRTDVTRTPQINSNLKKLLSYCKDVIVRYKLAHGLQLSDVTKELLTADNGMLGAAIRDRM